MKESYPQLWGIPSVGHCVLMVHCVTPMHHAWRRMYHHFGCRRKHEVSHETRVSHSGTTVNPCYMPYMWRCSVEFSGWSAATSTSQIDTLKIPLKAENWEVNIFQSMLWYLTSPILVAFSSLTIPLLFQHILLTLRYTKSGGMLSPLWETLTFRLDPIYNIWCNLSMETTNSTLFSGRFMKALMCIPKGNLHIWSYFLRLFHCSI